MAARRMVAKRKKRDKREGVKRVPYNIPDDIDLKIKHNELTDLMKGLDDDGFKEKYNEKKLISILRSAIRKEWMKDKTKLAFLTSKLIPDYEESNRRLWKMECDCCKKEFKKDEVEVDHIKGESTFTSLNDLWSFAESILNIGFDDLQVLCKPCHGIKTHAERYDLTFEQAVVDKQAIAWQKELNAVQQKAFLEEKGYRDDLIKTAKSRKTTYMNYVKGMLQVG